MMMMSDRDDCGDEKDVNVILRCPVREDGALPRVLGSIENTSSQRGDVVGTPRKKIQAQRRRREMTRDEGPKDVGENSAQQGSADDSLLAYDTQQFHEDLVQVAPLCEESVLNCMQDRFQDKLWYSLAGPTLIAVNPYVQETPLAVADYRRMEESGTPAPPHVYTIAQRALSLVGVIPQPQVIVLSGRSGAGKTYSANLVLDYLTEAQSDAVELARDSGQKRKNPIIAAIRASSHVLEAFGNAKTINNQDSSRFGKIIDLQIDADKNKHDITNGRLSTFLLETSRVTSQQEGEANFHVFLYVLAAAIRGDETIMQLLSVNNTLSMASRYVNERQAVSSEHAAAYYRLLDGFKAIGLSHIREIGVLKCVCAILLLGSLNLDAENKASCQSSEQTYADTACVDSDGVATPPSTPPPKSKTASDAPQTKGSVWKMNNTPVRRNLRKSAATSFRRGCLDFDCSHANVSLDSFVGDEASQDGVAKMATAFHGDGCVSREDGGHPSVTIRTDDGDGDGDGDGDVNEAKDSDDCESDEDNLAENLASEEPILPPFEAICEQVAFLLGIQAEDLKEYIHFQKLQCGREFIKKERSAEDIYPVIDALAKHVYSVLFREIAATINNSLTQSSSSSAETDDSFEASHSRIGLLDIFGFERLQENCLEQLCINFVNEKLQHHFVTHMVDAELKIYKEEGLDFPSIQPPNNDCLEVLAGKVSLFALLNESCRLKRIKAQSAEAAFRNRCDEAFTTQLHQRIYRGLAGKNSTTFAIKHYAGEVSYSSLNLVAKNKDQKREVFEALLAGSSNSVLNLDAEHALDNVLFDENSMDQQRPRHVAVASKRIGRVQSATVVAKFHKDMQKLFAQLAASHVHYIRCLSSNNAEKPECFDRDVMQEQVRAGGIIDSLAVFACGRPVHMPYSELMDTYRPLFAQSVPSDKDVDGPSCEQFLTRLFTTKGALAAKKKGQELADSPLFGRTMVFMRDEHIISLNNGGSAATKNDSAVHPP